MIEPANKIGLDSDLKVVRIRHPGGLRYSLRWVDSDGIETEVISSVDEVTCHRFEKAVRQIESRPDAAKLAVMLASSLVSIAGLAAKIRDSGDQAGAESYATKQHMRSWARDIMHYAVPALEHSGVLPLLKEQREQRAAEAP